jgi:hypothetical protein
VLVFVLVSLGAFVPWCEESIGLAAIVTLSAKRQIYLAPRHSKKNPRKSQTTLP